MKTAVEWFANRISHGGLVSKKQFDELLEKAKVMEEDGKHVSYLLGHNVGFTKAKQQEQCKCCQPKVGGYSCQRTDCNQNL